MLLTVGVGTGRQHARGPVHPLRWRLVSMSRYPRTTAKLAAAGLMALSAMMGVTVAAPPASAAAVGYVRLAHLSPDTPPVDVYLSVVAASGPAKKFPAVPYGGMSSYLPLDAGTYAVAMRNVGAP